MKWTRRDAVLGLPTLMAFNLIGCTAKTSATTNDETATTTETDKKHLVPHRLLLPKFWMAMHSPALLLMKMQFL